MWLLQDLLRQKQNCAIGIYEISVKMNWNISITATYQNQTARPYSYKLVYPVERSKPREWR